MCEELFSFELHLEQLCSEFTTSETDFDIANGLSSM